MPVALTRSQHVAHEEQVEFPALGRLRGLAVVVDAGDAMRVHHGMAPAGDVMPGRIDEQAKMHGGFCHPARSGAGAAYWLRDRTRPRCSRRVLPA